LAIAGHRFGGFDALASDMQRLSQSYGRPIDGILGYSFLADKIVLIDYPHRTLAVLDKAAQAGPLTRSCRSRWSIPLKTSESFPLIPEFRFGEATGAVTLDTGSNGGIALFPNALAIPGLPSKLTEKGEETHNGVQGKAVTKTYTLSTSVGFGPFTLPAGQTVTLHDRQWSSPDHVANIGNQLFAAMNLKMLLDYRARTMTFFGDCG